jgi:hypothetical protein
MSRWAHMLEMIKQVPIQNIQPPFNFKTVR